MRFIPLGEGNKASPDGTPDTRSERFEDGYRDSEYERDLPSGFFVIWVRLSTDKHRQVNRGIVSLSQIPTGKGEFLISGTPSASSRFFSLHSSVLP
jgi:hypothetical protein